MDLKEAADIIRRWTGKIESKLTGRSRDLKSFSSPSWEGREKEPAPTAQRSVTSTGNVQTSGKRCRSPGKSPPPKRSSPLAPDQFSRLTRDLSAPGKWQTHISSWNQIQSRFGIPDDRYEDFNYLEFLDIENPYVINYVNYHLNSEMPDIIGRLKSHSEFWETLNAPENVMQIVKYGFKVPFLKNPPKIFLDNNKSSLTSANASWVEQTLLEYEELGFISRTTEIPYCVLPLQVAEHPDKKSLIHDESPLNIYVDKKRFKLEGWEHMFNYSFSAKYGIKFDLKKFYYHIEIHPDFKKYFGFCFNIKGKTVFFMWNVLPFGYTLGPLMARDLLKPIITKWRNLGILCCVFFDDGMSVSNDKIFLKSASLQIKCDLLRAGLIPGTEKCVWKPCKALDWVGLHFDFNICEMSISQRRVADFKRKLHSFLLKWPKVTYRDASKITGLINSMHPVFNGKEQLYTRCLQTFINIRHFKDFSWDSYVSSDEDILFTMCLKELNFWIENFDLLNKRSFKPKTPTRIGWVDASSKATGGLIFKPTIPVLKKIYSVDDMLPSVHNNSAWHVDYVRRAVFSSSGNIFDKEHYTFNHYTLSESQKSADSNEREMIGGLNLVFGSKLFLENQCLTLHFDNENAVKIFKKGSSKFRLHNYALRMAKFCMVNNIELNPVAIPRDLNKFADSLSKMVDFEDYTVNQIFFDLVCKESGFNCNIDRFADNLNTKLPLFNSNSYCLGTSGVDCFSYCWGPPYINWLFPPPRLIMKAVNYLKLCKGKGLLLTPEWKTSSFFPYLLYLKNKFDLEVIRFKGLNIFELGSDKDSYFGPNFNCAVNVWILDFS